MGPKKQGIRCSASGRAFLYAALVLGIAWPGTSRATAGPSQTDTPAAGQAMASPPQANSQAEPRGNTPEYVLQRGDELEIKVFNIPELAEVLKIRPDGKISLQLLDEITAAGLTTTQLKEVVTNGYAKYYRNPRVTIIVKSFPNLNVYVGGEVARPGVIPIRQDLTALAAILQAGGITETAKTKQIYLLRNSGENGKPLVQRIDLNEILSKGKPDVPLQPFDVVYVPKSGIARADQFMRQYVRDLMPISINAGFSYLLGVTAIK